MPMAERKRCSGCGRDRKMTSINVSASGPTLAASKQCAHGPVAKRGCELGMLGNCRRAMRQRAAQMRCHPLAAQENLDGLLDDRRLDLLMHEVVGDAVVMLGDLDVIIETNPAALPLGILIRLIRQSGERPAIELLEQVAPTSSPAAQRSIVQLDEERMDRLVEGCEKKRRLRRRARIHRPTIWTPPSTWLCRAADTAVPERWWCGRGGRDRHRSG